MKKNFCFRMSAAMLAVVLCVGFASCSSDDDEEGAPIDLVNAQVSDIQKSFIGTWNVNYELLHNGEPDGWTSIWTIMENGQFTTKDSDDDMLGTRKYTIEKTGNIVYFKDLYQNVTFEIKSLTSNSFYLHAKDDRRERNVRGKRK